MTNENQRRGALSGTVVQQTLRYSPLDSSEIIVDDNRKAELDKLNTTGTDFVSISVEDDFVKASAVIKEAIDEYNAQIKKYYSYSDIIQTPKKKGDKTSVTAKSGVVNITDLGSKDSIKIVTEDRQNSITTHNSSKIKELKTADLQNLIPTGTAVGEGKMTGYTNAKYSAEITFNSANRKEFGDILKDKITQRINGNQKFEHYSQVVKDKLIEMNCAILTAQIDSSQQTPHTSLQSKISTTHDVVNVTGEYTFTRKPKKENTVLRKILQTTTNSTDQEQVKEKLKAEINNAIKVASLPQTEPKAIAQEHLTKLQAEVESLCKAEYIQRSFPGLYAVEHLSLHQHDSQYLTKAQKDQLFSVDIGDQTITDVLSNFKESDRQALTARINDGKTNDKITNFQLFEILKNQPAWTNLDRDEQSTVEIKLSGKMLSSDQNDIFTEFEAMLDQIAIFDVGDPGWKRSKGIVPFDTGQGKSFLVDDIIYKYNGLIKAFFDENDSVREFFEEQELAKTANSLKIYEKEQAILNRQKALQQKERAPNKLKEEQLEIKEELKELEQLKKQQTSFNPLKNKIKELESQAKEAAGDNAENLRQIQKQLEVFKQVAEDPKRYLKQYQLYAKGFEIININLANKEDLKTKSESKKSLHGQVIIIDEAIFIDEYIAQIRSLVDKGAKVIAVGATLSLPKTLEDIERKTDKIPNERELQDCRDELKQLQESKSITDILSKDAIDERKKDLSAQITGLENTQKNKKDFEPYARKTKMAEGNLSDIKERRNKAQGRLRHDKTTVTKSNLKEVNQSNWTRLVTEASAGEGKTQNIIPGLKLSFGKDATIAQLQKAANNTGELVVANFIEKGQHKIAFIQKGKTEVEIFDTNSEAFKEAFNKIPEQERESAEKIVDANYQLQIVSSKNNKLVVANFIEKVERGEKKELVEIHRIALIQPKDGDKEQKIEFFDAGSDTFKEAIKKISKEHPEQAKQAVMVYAGDYEFVVGGDYSNLSVLKEGDTQNIFLSKQEHVNIDLLKQMIGRDRSGRDDITRNIVCSQNSQANTTSKKDFIQQTTQNVKKKEISGLIGNLEKKILKRTALTDPEIQSSAEEDNDKSRQVKEITNLSAPLKRQIISGELRLNPDLVTQKGQLKLVSGVDSKDFFTKTSTISDLDLDEVKTDSDVISTKSPRPTDCNLTDISDINWNEEDHASSTYKLNRDLRSYLFWQNIEKGDFKFENYEDITKKPQDYGLDEEFVKSVKDLGDKPVQDEEFIELAFRISHCEKTTFAKRRDALLEVKATKLESLQTKWDKLKTEELSEKLEELQSAINEKLVTAHDELTAEGNNSKSEAAQKLKTIESKIIGEKTVSQLLEDYKKQIEDLDPDFNEKLRDSLQNNVSTTQDLVQTVKELALKIEQKGVTDVNLAKSELAGIITELKASEDEKTALKTENTALKADLESKSDKLATSEQKNQESLRRLADSAVREKQQAGRIKQLEQEKAEQAQQHAAQVATDLSSKGETEQKLQSDLENQKALNEALGNKLVTEQAKSSELGATLEEANNRVAEYSRIGTSLRQQTEAAQQKALKSSQETTRLTGQNKKLQADFEAYKTAKEEAEGKSTKEITGLRLAVKQSQQREQNLTNYNKKLAADKTGLENQLAPLINNQNILSQQNASLKSAIAQTKETLQNFKIASAAVKTQDQQSLTAQIQLDLRTSLEAQRKTLEEAAKTNLEKIQQDLQQEYEAQLAKLQSAQRDETKNFNDDRKRLTGEKTALTQTNTEQTTNFSRTKQNLELKIKNLNQAKEEADKRLKDFEEELEKEKAQHKQFQDKILKALNKTATIDSTSQVEDLLNALENLQQPTSPLKVDVSATTNTPPESPRGVTELESPTKTVHRTEDPRVSKLQVENTALKTQLTAQQDEPKQTTDAGTSTDSAEQQLKDAISKSKDLEIEGLKKQLKLLREGQKRETAEKNGRVAAAQNSREENVFKFANTQAKKQEEQDAKEEATRKALAAANTAATEATSRASAAEAENATLTEQLKEAEAAVTTATTTAAEAKAKAKTQEETKAGENSKEIEKLLELLKSLQQAQQTTATSAGTTSESPAAATAADPKDEELNKLIAQLASNTNQQAGHTETTTNTGAESASADTTSPENTAKLLSQIKDLLEAKLAAEQEQEKSASTSSAGKEGSSKVQLEEALAALKAINETRDEKDATITTLREDLAAANLKVTQREEQEAKAVESTSSATQTSTGSSTTTSTATSTDAVETVENSQEETRKELEEIRAKLTTSEAAATTAAAKAAEATKTSDERAGRIVELESLLKEEKNKNAVSATPSTPTAPSTNTESTGTPAAVGRKRKRENSNNEIDAAEDQPETTTQQGHDAAAPHINRSVFGFASNPSPMAVDPHSPYTGVNPELPGEQEEESTTTLPLRQDASLVHQAGSTELQEEILTPDTAINTAATTTTTTPVEEQRKAAAANTIGTAYTAAAATPGGSSSRGGGGRRTASTSSTTESKKEGHWFDEDSRSKKIIRVMNKLYAVKDKLDDTGFADFIGKIDSLQVGNTFDNLKAINKTFEGKNFSLTMADISVLDKMDDIDRKLVLDQSTDKDKNEKHRFDLVAIWDEYKKSQSADKISKILTSSSTKLSETDKVTFETQHEEGNKEEIYNSDSYPISPYEGISPSPTLVKVYTATKLTVGIERSPSEAFNLEGRGIGTSPALAG